MTPEFRLMSDISTFRNVASVMKNTHAVESLREWHGKDLFEHKNYSDGRAIPPEYLDFREKKRQGKLKDVEYKKIIDDDDQKY